MKKKTMFILAVIFLFLCTMFPVGHAICTAPKDCGSFSMEEYAYFTQNPDFQWDKKAAPASSVEQAAEAGRELISQRFENTENTMLHWMACEVFFNAAQEVWLIRIFPAFTPSESGNAYSTLIQKDGSVLALWGEE